MAGRTGRREACAGMRGVVCPVVIRRVARVAICRRSHEHIIDMARSARHRGVEAGQREGGVVVIEHRTGPGCRRVARSAGSGESRRYVIRICRAVVILGMAGIAVRWQRRIVASNVATRAGYGEMEASQREGTRLVIEARRIPSHRRVAKRTGGREAARHVAWVCRVVKVLRMA